MDSSLCIKQRPYLVHLVRKACSKMLAYRCMLRFFTNLFTRPALKYDRSPSVKNILRTVTPNLKIQAAEAALEFLDDHAIIGVGSGSTVNCFIDLLAAHKHRIDACVASSVETERRLRAHGFVVLELPVVDTLEIYFDGADEVDSQHRMIKGGGGALTREKIIATAAKTFVCMVEERKWVEHLGQFPVGVEVLPMARSLVARALVELGGDPVYRQGFLTDNGNIILDTYHFKPEAFKDLESEINQITGVVENGLFLRRPADIVVCAGDNGVRVSGPVY